MMGNGETICDTGKETTLLQLLSYVTKARGKQGKWMDLENLYIAITNTSDSGKMEW